ncbi:ATP-binding protein [Chryseobacterium sp. JJR-5R]|uniref:ATP-binding protein n=1 Tax=Chryseobacterium sp. JJR-5R TaxID=3093923 RepID=UPI002A764AD3|nr:ATP-binding protein [Chryseobacterium sp. JJR-5R]WPO81081.1 ATP-binding protein [Chryseobacterium sp. JJR-5R]
MKIRIKNFGPIKEGLLENDGWIKISKNTIFIGNQGSGKSTIAKLVSTFMWIEKALTRGDFDEKWLTRKNRFKNHFLTYHRLENYFWIDKKTTIEYIGDAYSFYYKDDNFTVAINLNGDYRLPQIMYIPSERNFISYVKTPNELKLSSDALNEFLTEFNNAKNALKNSIDFPINNLSIEYDKLNDVVNLKGSDYKVFLTESSSGFQSSIPLFLVTNYLANSVDSKVGHRESMSIEEQFRFRLNVDKIWSDKNLTDEQKRITISTLSSKFNKNVFFNIVEEPEQNLFPYSQFEIIKNLVSNNNKILGNKLIITSHSPYLMSFIGIMIEGHILFNKAVKSKNNIVEKKLKDILSSDLFIDPFEISIYEMNEESGTLRLLPNFEGIPSDNNFLNIGLKKSNDLFDKLLELEEQL